jgi:hypothetical protein
MPIAQMMPSRSFGTSFAAVSAFWIASAAIWIG